MTHWEGFLNGYQTLPDGSIGCCALDPGLELHRIFDGTDWVLEAKGTFYLRASNSRNFNFRVYFGDGGVGTYLVDFFRRRDDGSGPGNNDMGVMLRQKTGLNLEYQVSMVLLEESIEKLPISPWNDGVAITTYQFRLQRSGGVLAASWSNDGITWTTGWTHDLGTALVGLPQRVVFAGLVWFVPAGSYADWDYVRLTPTTIPVAIDIKPGSNPNSINPASNGVIPVAVLTDAAFDAASLDVATVRFGATGAEAAPVHSAMEDVDGDGDLDLVLHFRAQQTGLACGATSASLTGKTAGGQSILGSDAVNTAGCR
jgi:hypothetical protein